MSEINSSSYSTQYYVTGIRTTPTGQTGAGKATAADWTAATNAISTATAAGAGKTQADLEKLVETYQHLYAAILDGATVSQDLKTNTDAFAAEFQELFASLGSDTVKNSPKSQFLMVLGNLVQEQQTGNLSGYQRFIAEINQANLTSGPSDWERMMSVSLLVLASAQDLYETGVNLEAIQTTNRMAALDAEIEHDLDAAEQRKSAKDTQATAQIVGGSFAVVGGLAGGIQAGRASAFKTEYNSLAPQNGGAASAAANTALDQHKFAQSMSEAASGMGQGISSISQGSGSSSAATMEYAADISAADGKRNSMEATGSDAQAKAADRMVDSLTQSTGKILNDIQDNARANLQSMSHATQV